MLLKLITFALAIWMALAVGSYITSAFALVK